MAEELDNGAFWLPPKFLTDDDPLVELDNISFCKDFGWKHDGGVYFPNDLPRALGSFGTRFDLSSPVESVVSSTDAESDEEDYMSSLSQQMAHSTLEDDLWKVDSIFSHGNNQKRVVSGSPQSTLCTTLGGFCCKQRSSRGSPCCASQPSSPPTTSRNDAALDLLYAAAGEVAKMKVVEEGSGFYQSRGLLVPPRKPSPVSFPVKNTIAVVGRTSNHSQSPYQQLQATQFQQLKQQQMMKQQVSGMWEHVKGGAMPHQRVQPSNPVAQNRAMNGSGRSVDLSMCAWPTLQQSQLLQQQTQPGAGMRAVFLGSSGSKRECSGTGVFLPRRVGTPVESRKKSGCSTVLLPDRVVQALNLNIEVMDAQPQHQYRAKGSFVAGYDGGMKNRNIPVAQQRRNSSNRLAMSKEVLLPSEWTY